MERQDEVTAVHGVSNSINSAIYTPGSSPYAKYVPVLTTYTRQQLTFFTLCPTLLLCAHTHDSVSSSHRVPVFSCIHIWRLVQVTVCPSFQPYICDSISSQHDPVLRQLTQFRTCHGSSCQSPACHSRGPGWIPGHLVWDLWQVKRHWDSFVFEQFGFPC